MSELTEKVLSCLKQGERVVLATIIDHSGSTPRKAGSKMMVRSNREIFGTIGGGILEAEVLHRADHIIKGGGVEIRSFDFRNTKTASLDMICGGKVDVLIERLEAETSVIEIFEKVARVTRAGRRCLLGHIVDCPPDQVSLFVVDENDETPQTPLRNPDSDQIIKEAFKSDKPSSHDVENRRMILDPFYPEETVFLFGAGHVAQELAVLIKRVGFKCIVIDDRSEFASRSRFPDADVITVPESFEAVLDEISLNASSMVVIATRGHDFDETILENIIDRDVKYIGMMGSRRKRNTIYGHLEERGVSREKLDRVHSPIGLNIAAETPEEIAVSIVAELINARRKS